MDTAEFEKQFTALKSSKSLKEARKKEQREIDQQRSLTEVTSFDLARLPTADPDEQIQMKHRIGAALADLRRQANGTGPERAVSARAFNQLWIQGIEQGQEELRLRHLIQAEAYFELMGEAAPDRPWPLIMLAEVRVKAGNKKAAIKALEEAVKHGLKNPAALTQSPELQPLASEPGFQTIVEGLSAKKLPELPKSP